MLNMTARCGSTLVGQMLSRVPKVRVISEPWAFMHIHGLYVQRRISLPQYKRLLQSTLRLQCKRERLQYTHLFIKVGQCSNDFIGFFARKCRVFCFVFAIKILSNLVCVILLQKAVSFLNLSKMMCFLLNSQMSNFSGPCFPLLKELFPSIDQMFITRHVKPSTVSYVKVMRSLPQLWFRLGRTYDFWMKHMSFPVDEAEWWDRWERGQKHFDFT